MRRVLILFAHPVLERSRVNRRLLDGVRDLEGVTVHDLYEDVSDARHRRRSASRSCSSSTT